MKSECIVIGGKQMSGILKSITARTLRFCLHQSENLHTHRIYIDPDYVDFTKDKTFTRIEIVSNITTSSFINRIQVKIYLSRTVYSLSPGFWQSFISIEVCRDCIPTLASSCKKQLTGFFVCLLFFLKVKRIS